MLNAIHPDDERLSALASGDPDEVADAGLTAHVSSCDRCAELVEELGTLRMSLAELPDVAPSRRLRLVPAVADSERSASGVARWARRLFAPALTAGAALAMVGLVGTASPGALPSSFEEVGLGGGDAGVMSGADEAAPGADDPGVLGAGEEREGAAPDHVGQDWAAAPEAEEDGSARTADEIRPETTGLPAERSPWPMVLFTGVAVMIGAVLLRWILVPRAG